MSENPTSSRRDARRKPVADDGTFGVNLRTDDAGYNWITWDYSCETQPRPSENARQCRLSRDRRSEGNRSTKSYEAERVCSCGSCDSWIVFVRRKETRPIRRRLVGAGQRFTANVDQTPQREKRGLRPVLDPSSIEFRLELSRLISRLRFRHLNASVDTEISAQVTCASVRVSDKKSARRRRSFLLSLFD